MPLPIFNKWFLDVIDEVAGLVSSFGWDSRLREECAISELGVSASSGGLMLLRKSEIPVSCLAKMQDLSARNPSFSCSNSFGDKPYSTFAVDRYFFINLPP